MDNYLDSKSRIPSDQEISLLQWDLREKLTYGSVYNLKLVIMKSSYNFQEQVRFLQDIVTTDVALAELANKHFKTIPPSIISLAVQELKEEYTIELGDQVEQNTKIAIKSTLNLAAREQVTNIDELFVNLSQEINSYYQKDLIKVTKRIPFLKVCSHCHEPVSNDTQGHKWHQEQCKNEKKKNRTIAPQKKSKKKPLDTFIKYEQRQKKLFEVKVAEKQEQQQQVWENKQSQKQSKRSRLKKKVQSKYSKNLNHLFQQDYHLDELGNEAQELLNIQHILPDSPKNKLVSSKVTIIEGLIKENPQKKDIFSEQREESNELDRKYLV